MNKIQSTEGLTEKQIARRAYARAYYAAHKDKIIAAVRVSQAKRAKAAKKPAKKDTKPAKKDAKAVAKEMTAMHAICPAKVADKALAKLQKSLQKAEQKVSEMRAKLDEAKLLVQAAKDAVKARKAELKAAKGSPADAKYAVRRPGGASGAPRPEGKHPANRQCVCSRVLQGARRQVQGRVQEMPTEQEGQA